MIGDIMIVLGLTGVLILFVVAIHDEVVNARADRRWDAARERLLKTYKERTQ